MIINVRACSFILSFFAKLSPADDLGIFGRAPSGLMLSLVQIFFANLRSSSGWALWFPFLQHIIVHMAQGFIIFQCFGLKYNNHLGKVGDWGIARIFHIIVRQTKGMCHCH